MKKKKIKYINFDGELEDTDIRLKIGDVRINDITLLNRLINRRT